MTLVLFFVLFVGVYGQSNLYEFDPQDVLACAMSVGITYELLEDVSYVKPEELYDQVPEARCFLACVLRKMGQFTGDADSPIVKDLQEKFASTSGFDFDAVIDECKTKPGELDDGTCMKEYKAFSCFAEKLQEIAKRLEEENEAESAVDAAPEGWQPRMELEDESDKEVEKEEDVKKKEKIKEEMKDEKKIESKDEKKKEQKKQEEKKADKKSEEKKPGKKADGKKKEDKKPDEKKDEKKKKTEL